MDEISQIAGRAGRFSNDGFFGTTCNLKKLDNNIINFVENYEYTEITKIFWRNKKLSFTSPEDLLKSLSKYPQENYFKLKKNGNDHRYLRIFLEDKVVKKNVSKFYNLKKLWEVCSIPDYSKNLDEYHTRFLKKVFTYLKIICIKYSPAKLNNQFHSHKKLILLPLEYLHLAAY